MDEVTDGAVGLGQLGRISLGFGAHAPRHHFSSVAEVVEADHRKEAQEEPEEDSRKTPMLTLCLNHFVQGFTQHKYSYSLAFDTPVVFGPVTGVETKGGGASPRSA